MKLVMFDMDGTLTDAFAIEENCYVLAIGQALNIPDVHIDWDSYPHTSSTYCLETVVQKALGRPPTPAEATAVQARMIEIMDEATARHGRRTQEVPGAAAAVRELLRLGYAVAIASGDWEATARHKLTAASIPFENLPSAYSDVAHARTDIMRAALERALIAHECKSFERIVYVGDAAWDVRACRELNWPLVVIAEGAHAARLDALGATTVIPHYVELPKFIAAIGEATAPRPAA
ncbi:MAG: Haloacid dehalogenase domain protein hydrolase [Lacunisphaera sp.]|jgi:phosphoglycolate phosphatase-like HAD superfamily hydrolase|nr:Haloacid dehalogenase domain protein hydrolase [Lacunisphaera sp.]